MDTSPLRTSDVPIRLAVVNDYELVVRGVAGMLLPFHDRVQVVELQVDGAPDRPVDIALFDMFGSTETSVLERCRQMRRDRAIGHLVLYTWHLSALAVQRARQAGVDGVVMKSEPAERLVESLERVCRGEAVGLEPATVERLTAREHEILELMATGRTNLEIARSLYVSEETVKTYAKRLFRKLGVRNRVEAAIRASELGFAGR